MHSHCNSRPMAPSPLHCNRVALKSLCTALQSHCAAFALHCMAIAFHCNRIALRHNRIAIQSLCIALYCIAIAPFLPPSCLPPGPGGRCHLRSRSPRTYPPFLPVGLEKKTEGREADGEIVPSDCVALQSQRIALQSQCNSRPIASSPLYCNRTAL